MSMYAKYEATDKRCENIVSLQNRSKQSKWFKIKRRIKRKQTKNNKNQPPIQPKLQRKCTLLNEIGKSEKVFEPKNAEMNPNVVFFRAHTDKHAQITNRTLR